MKILGLMSGTSLDGLDMVLLDIKNYRKWEIKKATTVRYSNKFRALIQNVRFKSAQDLALTEFIYSEQVAKMVLKFIRSSAEQPDYISFPGQTLFHQPQNGFTYQLGSGSVLAALTQVPVVSDFRTADVALGGQGAPLVPCMEFELWQGVDIFLNLGGIANFSFKDKENQIRGRDICPCNMALNELASLCGLEFDKNGNMASRGKTDSAMVKLLVEKFKRNNKSLGYEDYEKKWKKMIFSKRSKNIHNNFSIVTEAIAECIVSEIAKYNPGNIMVSGGGAWNKELIKRLKNKFPSANWIIPDPRVINFKEAIVFAFLAYKRIKNEINILSSVTGSSRNHIAGCIHL
jgi:anhydro-N-acetylmuramic acid kinase